MTSAWIALVGGLLVLLAAWFDRRAERELPEAPNGYIRWIAFSNIAFVFAGVCLVVSIALLPTGG